MSLRIGDNVIITVDTVTAGLRKLSEEKRKSGEQKKSERKGKQKSMNGKHSDISSEFLS